MKKEEETENLQASRQNATTALKRVFAALGPPSSRLFFFPSPPEGTGVSEDRTPSFHQTLWQQQLRLTRSRLTRRERIASHRAPEATTNTTRLRRG